MDDPNSQTSQTGEQNSASALGGTGDKLTGGKEDSGDSQSYLDKGISYLQQSVTGKSGQTNTTSTEPGSSTSHHAAVDEAHPEKIAEFLRDQNGSMTKEEQGK